MSNQKNIKLSIAIVGPSVSLWVSFMFIRSSPFFLSYESKEAYVDSVGTCVHWASHAFHGPQQAYQLVTASVWFWVVGAQDDDAESLPSVRLAA